MPPCPKQILIRALLPFAFLLLSMPLIFRDELMTFISLPIFYFFGSYFIFLNFPSIGEHLHGKPIYIDDLILQGNGVIRDETFKQIYDTVMDFMLALLVAVFSEYIMIQDISDKPLIEITAVIGGNIAVYTGAQNLISSFMLQACHCLKEVEVHRRNSINLNNNNSEEKYPGNN